MANKIVTLKDKSNNDLYPVVLSSCVYDENNNPLVIKDTIVETYISSDGLTWFRKWASGWKDCGATFTITNNWTWYTLPIAFSNNKYSVVGSMGTRQAFGISTNENEKEVQRIYCAMSNASGEKLTVICKGY